MALVSVVFSRRARFGVGASDEFLPYGAVELDASLEESHTASNEVTQFPVEAGVDITDHVRRQPDRVVIRGVVTDHPLGIPGSIVSRSLDAYQRALLMVQEAQLISVVTTLRQYQNMVVEQLEVPRDNRRGTSVEMSLTLREIQTAQVASTVGTNDLGTQQTSEVT